MARILTYDLDPTIQPGDRIIGTDVLDNSTKNFTIEALGIYINSLPGAGGIPEGNALPDPSEDGDLFNLINPIDTSLVEGLYRRNETVFVRLGEATGTSLSYDDIVNAIGTARAADFRTFIGAGTSNFSGAYSDLTGAPVTISTQQAANIVTNNGKNAVTAVASESTDPELPGIMIGATRYRIPEGSAPPPPPPPATPPFAAGTLAAALPSGTSTTNGALTSVVVTLTPTWSALTGATITGVAVSGPGITGSMTLPVEGTGDPVVLAAQNLATGNHTWTLTVTGTDSATTARTFTRTASISITRTQDPARAGLSTDNPLTGTSDISHFTTAANAEPRMITADSSGTAAAVSYIWVLLDRDITTGVIINDAAGMVPFNAPRAVTIGGIQYQAYQSTGTVIDLGSAAGNIPLTITYN